MGRRNLADLNIQENSSSQQRMMSHYLPVRVFYFLVLFDFIRDTLNSLSAILVSKQTNFIFPYSVSFFDFFDKKFIGVGLMLLGVIVTFHSITRPHSQWGRIAAFFYFVISKGFIFSATRFNHHYIPMTWALLCFTLYSPEVNEASFKFYRKVYSLCLFCIASFYFFPGLWKVAFGLVQGELTRSEFGANTIAFFFISQGQNSYLGPLFIEYQWVSYIGFLTIILLQLSSMYAWYNPNYQRLWALFILMFHLISILALNVNFFVAGTVTFIFFFLSPFVNRESDWLAKILIFLKMKSKSKLSPL